MLINAQTLQKISKIEARYSALRFKPEHELEALYHDTFEHLRELPKGVQWKPAIKGERWGGDWRTRWFKASFSMPKSLAGKKVFLMAKTGAPESLALVDGEFKGVLGGNDVDNGACKHIAICLALKAIGGKRHEIALEAYAGHSFPGTQPDDAPRKVTPSSCLYDGIEIASEREEASAFVFDLMAARQTMEALGDESLRKHEIAKELETVFSIVPAMPSELEEAEWLPPMREAHARIKRILCPSGKKTKTSLPKMGLIGHSHLDTAWLWTVEETTRKCARTFSSVLNLMEQYPEFVFLQSAPYHADVTRKEYPSIFKAIKRRVAEGRWEPNGAMWVEPDCNVPSGEAFVRQLLYGQLATREMFGYTSDTLWLPDVFGYSGALPQILLKAGVKFFCTTKMAWGEVKFPYDSFFWEGIDGSSVLSHLHKIHFIPDPKTLSGFWNAVQHKDAQSSVLCPFGFGDGGGGPHADMLEAARRSMQGEDLFKAEYASVTSFMEGLEENSERLPAWSGELYLSAHRGTLTSIAKTKRLNRKLEFALRDAEILSSLAWLDGSPYPKEELDSAWKTLLLNQFHDILPGSSIAEVNDKAGKELAETLENVESLSKRAAKAVSGKAGGSAISAFNTLGWERKGIELVRLPEGAKPEKESMQSFESLDGKRKAFIDLQPLPALSGATISGAKRKSNGGKSPFKHAERSVETPFLKISFDAKGRIVSCLDKSSGREAVRPGGAFNKLLLAEDVPAAWDNWDVNEDLKLKEREEARLVSRKIASEGPFALCLRSEWKIGRNSTLWQDMAFYADSPRIDFLSKIDWQERHAFLRTAFDIDLVSDAARYEIQYGHLERPRHSNLKEDRAKFETAVHKWMDVSEASFGIALLNDCKYGANANRERMTLSLMKSGTHPDPRGDAGVHLFSYSLLLHGAFGSEIARKAYEFNSPLLTFPGELKAMKPLLGVDKANVFVECVKRAENGKGLVFRLYEASRSGSFAKLSFSAAIKSASETDLLEQNPKALKLKDGKAEVYFRPFEIKTILCKI